MITLSYAVSKILFEEDDTTRDFKVKIYNEILMDQAIQRGDKTYKQLWVFENIALQVVEVGVEVGVEGNS